MIVSCGSLQCSAVWPVPNCNSNRLKHIQNATFHLITLTAKHDHITANLFNLHWLPLKIFLTAYKALYYLTLLYTCDVLTSYTQIMSTTLITQASSFNSVL